MLGLRFCARAFSSCGERGPLFIAVRGPLTVAASLVAEHRLQTRRLSNRGSRAQLLRGMWDPPRPGLEPASPALAGRFSTTAPPGKPSFLILCMYIYLCVLLKMEETPAPKRQHSRSVSTGLQGRKWEPALRGALPRQCVWLAHLRGDLHPHSGQNPPCQEPKVVSLVSLGNECPRDSAVGVGSSPTHSWM